MLKNQVDYNSLEEVLEELRYHKELLDYLDDCIPCLGDVISNFDEEYKK